MGDVLTFVSLDEEPDSAKLIARARATGQPCRVTKDGKPLAIILPLREKDDALAWPEEEREAFLALAGLLSDTEGERAFQHMREHREAARQIEHVDPRATCSTPMSSSTS